jgi:HEAT repeat protein
MKSSPSANSGDRIRLKVLWPVMLLVALILIAVIFTRSRSHSPVPLQAEGRAPTAISNTASTPRPAAPTRRSLQSPPPAMEPETARLISVMLDKSAKPQLRRQAARALGKIGTDEAMAALRNALADTNPPFLKAAIAEGLGESPNPQARDLLHELVGAKDETIARGAARGLGVRGDADAVDTLGNLLFNDKTSEGLRTEAALALGDVNLSSALDVLTRAVSQIHDEDIVESVLDGLGRRPFSETQEFFRNYLNSPDVPPESKVLVIEAVRDAEGDVVPFLSNYLNDPNSDVREAAKEALDFLSPNPTKPTGPAR